MANLEDVQVCKAIHLFAFYLLILPLIFTSACKLGTTNSDRKCRRHLKVSISWTPIQFSGRGQFFYTTFIARVRWTEPLPTSIDFKVLLFFSCIATLQRKKSEHLKQQLDRARRLSSAYIQRPTFFHILSLWALTNRVKLIQYIFGTVKPFDRAQKF